MTFLSNRWILLATSGGILMRYQMRWWLEISHGLDVHVGSYDCTTNPCVTDPYDICVNTTWFTNPQIVFIDRQYLGCKQEPVMMESQLSFGFMKSCCIRTSCDWWMDSINRGFLLVPLICFTQMLYQIRLHAFLSHRTASNCFILIPVIYDRNNNITWGGAAVAFHNAEGRVKPHQQST